MLLPARRYGTASLAVAVLTFLCYKVLAVNATSAALLMLLLVLGAAAHWGLGEAFLTSVLCVLTLNFYFLPPIGTFTVSDPENWVALFVFVVTSIVASQLSAQVKHRAEEAEAGRIQIEKLYEVSRAMLMEDARETMRLSLIKTGQIMGLTNIAFLDAATEKIYGTLGDSGLTQEDLHRVAELGQACGSERASVTPVLLGTRIVGSLAVHGEPMEVAVRESIAGLLAIHYERAQALERASAAEVARRNEEFRSSLLDGLAHDLKTPLTAIRTCITRLIQIPPRSEEVRQELLSIIDQESIRLQNSITEAIQLSRIESQSLHLNIETFNAAEFLRASVESTRDENPARYSVTVDPEDLTLQADPELLSRAIRQILENARKYAPPDSPVTITARQEDGRAILSFADRGPGIAPDEVEKIFEKFYRGRRTTAAEGTGMGLAIARGIIEAHGGKIRAANRPGGGAVISLILKAHE